MDGPEPGFALHLRHEIVVDRPIAAVFAVATTARHWPAWHPATVRVEGATQAPARLGDRIVEHVRIAHHEGSGTWTVVVCTPPHRLVLDSTDAGIGHVRIGYTLTEQGRGTRFVRELELPALSAPVEAAMHEQSAAGLAALAKLLEREIPAEVAEAGEP
jgi:uncharacterized protein YndB with AHSA1/START domain